MYFCVLSSVWPILDQNRSPSLSKEPVVLTNTVSPKLKLGRNEDQLLFGRVATSFANPFYVADHCPTPIQIGIDPVYAASTCIQIEFAVQSYVSRLRLYCPSADRYYQVP